MLDLDYKGDLEEKVKTDSPWLHVNDDKGIYCTINQSLHRSLGYSSITCQKTKDD